MNALKWVGVAGGLGLVVLVVFVAVRQRAGPPAGPVPAVPEVAVSPEQPAAPVAAPPAPAPKPVVAAAPTAPEPISGVPAAGGAVGKTLRVKPEQTLAVVNGVAITLKDLVPLPPEKTNAPQLMSAEMYGSLLNRAVEREVTFQEASRQGVELTTVQRQRLADMRSRSERRDPGVFDTVQQNPANVEFEQRDSAALLLQAALAAKAGVPSPHVTAAHVQAEYEEHKAEYGTLPAAVAERQAAWDKIDQAIRQKLAPQLQAEHQDHFQKFLEQLKGAAQITTATPTF